MMNIFTVLTLNILIQMSNASYQKQHIYQGGAIQYGKSLEFFSCRNCQTPSVKTKRAPAETPKIRARLGQQPNGATVPKSSTKNYPENQLPRISKNGNSPVNLENKKPVNQKKKVIVYFDFDRANIKEEEKEKILGIKGAPIRITGYTDSTGLKERNDVLSEERAKVVADFIKSTKGIMLSSKVVQGKGLCCYAETNETAKGRARNRRVEIIFRTVTYKGANTQ